jgi:hypothetical protein
VVLATDSVLLAHSSRTHQELTSSLFINGPTSCGPKALSRNSLVFVTYADVLLGDLYSDDAWLNAFDDRFPKFINNRARMEGME